MSASMLLTVRHALLALWRNPRFVLLASLMLALGIASTTTIYTLIRGVLLTPPPYAEPEELVFVTTAAADDRDEPAVFNWPQQLWTEWLAGNESFESIAGYRWVFNFLISDDGSEALEGMMVSEGYFSVVGIEPALGRAFVEADLDGTENPVIIIGHDLWMRRFNADPDIIGQTIQMSRQPPTTVIGVMPPDVRFLPSPSVASEPNYDMHAKVDYWLPIPPEMRDQPAWNAIARLEPGVSVTAAETEVAVLLARYADAVPAIAGLGARIEPLTSILNAEGRRLLLPLLAAALLVLLIACGNATALLLIRGLQRQHEYGLRSAIGASRGRLFGLVIGESLMLALLSGSIGVMLAFGLVRLFTDAGGAAIPRLDQVAIGWPVFTFGFGAALIACLAAGLLPALYATRLDPVAALRMGGQKSSQARGHRSVLGSVVVGQTALTLALLVAAGLMIRTLYNLDIVQPGYDTRNLLTMSVTAVDSDYRSFHERALERVSVLPGVAGAAFAWGVPLTGNAWQSRIQIEGFDPLDQSDGYVAMPLRSVTSGYFDMLGQPVTLGRDFRNSDDQDSEQVAIVNEAFVARYLGGGNAIGRKIWPRGQDSGPAATIVGVIGNSRTNDLTAVAEPEAYLHLWQAGAFSKHLVVRSSLAPEIVASSVLAALRELAPTVAIENVKTLDEIRSESLAGRALAMRLLIGFGAIACILTLGGLYSVLSLSVTARQREIAIRSAIGAERNRILKLVIGNGLRMIAIGALLGVALSIALSRLLEAWLYGVESADPLTLLAATTLFVLVALIACSAPALRASSIPPVEALRSE